jgi:hypothetical protein
MRNRFDYVAKELGQKALGSSGMATTQEAVNAETQYADLRYEPDPARQSERDRLGLLGQLASKACLIEVYSQAPSAEDFRACLSKHLAVWRQRARDARSESRERGERPPEEAMVSFLWILAAGAPATLLTKLKLEPSPSWPPGIYLFHEDVLRVGLVVASELPRDRTTLLVRLMAAGPLLPPAVDEVAALPAGAYERTVAQPILLQFAHIVRKQQTRTSEEQEFIMAMLKTWEEHKAEGRAKGLAEGRAEGLAEGVLAVLRARGIAVPDAARERILAQTDPDVLRRWLDRATVVSSIGDVLDER